MAGVKKTKPRRKAGKRSAEAPKTKRKAGKRSAEAPKTKRKAGKRSAEAPKTKRKATPAVATRKAAPTRKLLQIRELDPYRKCGPGTSVERLIRVDEEVGGRKEAHLVYLDRHGWYCEHGRTCHAVRHAQKGAATRR